MNHVKYTLGISLSLTSCVPRNTACQRQATWALKPTQELSPFSWEFEVNREKEDNSCVDFDARL